MLPYWDDLAEVMKMSKEAVQEMYRNILAGRRQAIACETCGNIMDPDTDEVFTVRTNTVTDDGKTVISQSHMCGTCAVKVGGATGHV